MLFRSVDTGVWFPHIVSYEWDARAGFKNVRRKTTDVYSNFRRATTEVKTEFRLPGVPLPDAHP